MPLIPASVFNRGQIQRVSATLQNCLFNFAPQNRRSSSRSSLILVNSHLLAQGGLKPKTCPGTHIYGCKGSAHYSKSAVITRLNASRFHTRPNGNSHHSEQFAVSLGVIAFKKLCLDTSKALVRGTKKKL